jgi:hypothetical protein
MVDERRRRSATMAAVDVAVERRADGALVLRSVAVGDGVRSAMVSGSSMR